MQEEVTRGAVTLIVDGAKLSEQVFEKAVKKFLEEIQKSQKPKIYQMILRIIKSICLIDNFPPFFNKENSDSPGSFDITRK